MSWIQTLFMYTVKICPSLFSASRQFSKNQKGPDDDQHSIKIIIPSQRSWNTTWHTDSLLHPSQGEMEIDNSSEFQSRLQTQTALAHIFVFAANPGIFCANTSSAYFIPGRAPERFCIFIEFSDFPEKMSMPSLAFHHKDWHVDFAFVYVINSIWVLLLQ